MMTDRAAIDRLNELGACSEAIEWCRGREAAWDACERGDWMLWLCGRLAGPPGSDSRKPLVLAACECARLSLHLVPAGEDRPRRAIETAEAWCRGEATLDQVRRAATAAATAAGWAAGWAAADAAAAAAADAAYAAAAAAADWAPDAAAAAAADAAAAAVAAFVADAAFASTLKQCADIVRRHYPTCPLLTEVTSDD